MYDFTTESLILSPAMAHVPRGKPFLPSKLRKFNFHPCFEHKTKFLFFPEHAIVF
jgi:hypothetical protein